LIEYSHLLPDSIEYSDHILFPLSSTQLSSKEVAVCPILETILNADPPNTPLELQKRYQTLVLHSIVDYLQMGNEDICSFSKGQT